MRPQLTSVHTNNVTDLVCFNAAEILPCVIDLVCFNAAETLLCVIEHLCVSMQLRLCHAS